MKIEFDPKRVKHPSIQSMKVDTIIHGSAEALPPYWAEFQFGTGNGAIASVTADEARMLIVQLETHVARLAAHDGNALQLGREMGMPR